jgi:hypothetical protein
MGSDNGASLVKGMCIGFVIGVLLTSIGAFG